MGRTGARPPAALPGPNTRHAGAVANLPRKFADFGGIWPKSANFWGVLCHRTGVSETGASGIPGRPEPVSQRLARLTNTSVMPAAISTTAAAAGAIMAAPVLAIVFGWSEAEDSSADSGDSGEPSPPAWFWL